MFYVYLDSPYGTELIGRAENGEKAEKIKQEVLQDWKPGDLWNVRVTEKEEKEFTCFD